MFFFIIIITITLLMSQTQSIGMKQGVKSAKRNNTLTHYDIFVKHGICYPP